MVHPTNHIWRIGNLHCALSVSWFTLRTIFNKISNLHCDYSVILFNLYGISIDTRFYPFFVVHGLSYESLSSVGLAQARPNHLHLPVKHWKVYTEVHITEVTIENAVSYNCALPCSTNCRNHTLFIFIIYIYQLGVLRCT